MRLALEQVGDRDDEPRRAEAALHGARPEQRLLHGREQPVPGRRGGAYLGAVGLHRRHEARAR
jgi:hypothetical protein